MVLDVIMVDKLPSSKQRISIDYQPQVGKYSDGDQSGGSTDAHLSAPKRRQPPEYGHQEAILPQTRNKINATVQLNSARHGNVISRARKYTNSTTDTRVQTTATSITARKLSDVSKIGRGTMELPALTPRRKISTATSHPSLRTPLSNTLTMTQLRSTSCPSFAATHDGKDRMASRQRKTRSLSLEPSHVVTAGQSPTKEHCFNNNLSEVPNHKQTELEQNFPDIAENAEESSDPATEPERKYPTVKVVQGPPMHIMSRTRQKLYKAAHSANPALYKYDWRTGDEKLFESYQDIFSAQGRKYLNVSDISPDIAEQVLAQHDTDDCSSDPKDKCTKWLQSLPFFGTDYGVNYRVEAEFDDCSEKQSTDIVTSDKSAETYDDR